MALREPPVAEHRARRVIERVPGSRSRWFDSPYVSLDLINQTGFPLESGRKTWARSITPRMSNTPVPLRNRHLAALLAWMIPGLGHIYQKRTSKGILYAVCILTLYFLGFAFGQGKNVYWRWVNPLHSPDKFCLHYLGQFFVGLPALPALIQATLVHYGFPTLLGGFMAEPSQNVINGLNSSGRLVDVGTIYTTVAGLLNVLAIYDALEGPAYADLEAEELEENAAETAGSSETNLDRIKVEPTT